MALKNPHQCHHQMCCWYGSERELYNIRWNADIMIIHT